jgi:5-methylcytosine-specific restriction enzyme subunit McrC
MTTQIPRHSLVEFQTKHGVALTAVERDAIRRAHPKLRIEPTIGYEGRYDLTPDQNVGVISLPTVVLEIRPKVPMSSVLFLVSYACGLARWHDAEPELADNPDIVELMAIILSRAITKATRRGLLCGYRTEDEPLRSPRGRIVFDEFIRRRYANPPPIDVRHDIFTADIAENRLLLAALESLRRFPLRSQLARREVVRAARPFGEVSFVMFAPANVPNVPRTRLNAHYDSALTLARLVLRSASLDLGTGGARGAAFLIDMNKVFETFVRTAVRDVLGVTRRELPDKAQDLWLDDGQQVTIEPDLSLRDGDKIRWIADVKYKRLSEGKHENGDLYQLLAYAVALNLNSGTLIYAAEKGHHHAEHVVAHAGKRLRLVALDLFRPPLKLEEQVAALVKCLG